MRSSEFLTYVLLIVGFVLFNFLIQRTARRARQRQEQEAAQQQPAAQQQEAVRRQEESAPPPEEPPLESIWGRERAEGSTAAVPVAPAPRVEASYPSPARTGPTVLFDSRRELRHAIVVMTLLGPCRALEPHDRGQPWQAMGGAPANRS